VIASESAGRGAIVERLSSFVARACNDPVFRRELRYRPEGALAQFGFAIDAVPETLPIRHYEVSADFAAEVLFGDPSASRDAPRENLPIEVREVAYGLKPMALIHGAVEHVEALIPQARELELHVLLSPYEFTPEADESAGGYVNLACARRPATARSPTTRSPTVHSGAWRGALVARDWHQLQLGWLSLLFGWDTFLGILLGYPPCCARAYADNWPLVAAEFRGEYGALLAARAGTETEPALVIQPSHRAMNVFARYFGVHVLDHFPCDFRCEATHRLGERMCAGLGEMEPAAAGKLIHALGLPILQVNGEGAFLFERATWDTERATLEYEPSAIRSSNARSDLHRVLQSADRLTVTDAGIHAGDRRLDGHLFVFPALQ
jgi:hypothetical protein